MDPGASSPERPPAPKSGPVGEERKSIPEKYGTVMKALSIAVGVLLIGLGIFSYATLSLSDPMDVILPFYYMLFGLLMIAAEVGAKFLTGSFKFVENFMGRGLFYIFVGTLCLRGSNPFQYVVAGILLVVGIVYLCCYCGVQRKQDQEKEARELTVQQPSAPQANPAPAQSGAFGAAPNQV